jgi:hypothetical protein
MFPRISGRNWAPAIITDAGMGRTTVKTELWHNNVAPFGQNRRMLVGMERLLPWAWNGFSW